MPAVPNSPERFSARGSKNYARRSDFPAAHTDNVLSFNHYKTVSEFFLCSGSKRRLQEKLGAADMFSLGLCENSKNGGFCWGRLKNFGAAARIVEAAARILRGAARIREAAAKISGATVPIFRISAETCTAFFWGGCSVSWKLCKNDSNPRTNFSSHSIAFSYFCKRNP